MLIETRVQPSAIHGLGVFAVDAIPGGTPVWKFQPGFDQTFSPQDFSELPPLTQDHLRWFAFLDAASGCWILSGDHACFMNHSAAPNTGALADASMPVVTVASRDLAAGEEITCDYFAFDLAAAKKLGPLAGKK